MAEGYSREKFEEAQEKGLENLSQDEKELLERYRKIEGNKVIGANMVDLLIDVLVKDRRALRFGQGEATKFTLEQKMLNNPAAQEQLGLAQEEAGELNDEYNRRKEALRKAAQEFEEIAQKVNGRETAK